MNESSLNANTNGEHAENIELLKEELHAAQLRIAKLLREKRELEKNLLDPTIDWVHSRTCRCTSCKAEAKGAHP